MNEFNEWCHLQSLEMVKELPVMLLVMMLAFFRADPPCHAPAGGNASSSTSKNSSSNNSSGQPRKPRMVLQQPEKVMRIHDYYMHKLQVHVQNFVLDRWNFIAIKICIDPHQTLYFQIYLKLRYPSSAVGGALHTIISTIDKVCLFLLNVLILWLMFYLDQLSMIWFSFTNNSWSWCLPFWYLSNFSNI